MFIQKLKKVTHETNIQTISYNKLHYFVVYKYVVYTLILLFRNLDQLLSAISKSNSFKGGPSIQILINASKVVVFIRFRRSVLILFIAENDLSQSAVLTGRIKQIFASLLRFGYSTFTVAFPATSFKT